MKAFIFDLDGIIVDTAKYHFKSWKIISKNFVGKSKIEQHKMVYKALKGKMGNELHALALTTEEKNG